MIINTLLLFKFWLIKKCGVYGARDLIRNTIFNLEEGRESQSEGRFGELDKSAHCASKRRPQREASMKGMPCIEMLLRPLCITHCFDGRLGTAQTVGSGPPRTVQNACGPAHPTRFTCINHQKQIPLLFFYSDWNFCIIITKKILIFIMQINN